MITDEQGRQWILQKLYDKGFKYLYFNEYLNEMRASDAPPEVNYDGKLWTSSDSKLNRSASLEKIIEIDKPYIDIGKELGIVDWSKVPVDTPIIVWDNDDLTKKNRHFAKYEDGIVYAFKGGHTSWTICDELDLMEWDNARLAEVDKN